ncbi:MAG: hypothetical protein HY579_09480 [Nitrospinae bacterium]|nr:hypothetical protein [Nitrospinota bacterium]
MRGTVLPLIFSVELAAFRPMPVIFSSDRVKSSPASETPFWFESRQTLRSPNRASLASMTPSALESRSANAANPSAAMPAPLLIGAALPNSSEPLPIAPSPFRSRARKPSSAETQAVRSAKPLASKSKGSLSQPENRVPPPHSAYKCYTDCQLEAMTG